MTTITTFGLDSNMRSAIDTVIDVDNHCEDTLHTASKTQRQQTDIAIILVFSEVTQDICDQSSFDTIISLGAGTDHIDIEACHSNDIVACNTPAYGSNTVAEHTFALLLNHERHLRDIQGEQTPFSREPYLGQQLAGKTFGALGTGGIGKAAVRIAQGFDMETIGYDVEEDNTLHDQDVFTYKSLSEVLAAADVLGLYAPATPSTTNIIGKDALTTMKQDAILVNTAREQLIDHEALLEALASKEIRGALLDVVDNDYYDALNQRDDTIITPIMRSTQNKPSNPWQTKQKTS